MPFVPFKKGGGKAAPPKGKLPATKKGAVPRANPFASGAAGQPKKTKRNPFV